MLTSNANRREDEESTKEVVWNCTDYNADKLPEGKLRKLSTKGVDSTAPDFSEVQTLEDGVVVPLGKPKEQRGPKGSLLYNEYIVYNVDQIRMRYIIQHNIDQIQLESFNNSGPLQVPTAVP
ncbi:unnamed protein product [Ilex paraguariensis]|uniref:Poly [ADP-ribose] polymerase n=1 Tax=Ilex paraguariensis TaxID=185542 RepID=A0ABC8U5H7_9AQUA